VYLLPILIPSTYHLSPTNGWLTTHDWQLGGEGVGIKPDLIGGAIAAYLLECGVSAEGEPYFVDPVYRPNPDDYQPSQLILQYNLRPLPP